MVSIFSSHFFNWVKQLENSGHQIYWLDVYDSNTYVEKISFVEQIIGWRYKWDFKGRNYLKKNHKKLYQRISKFNERDLEHFFEKKVKEIKPDVVHSFSMQNACYPIKNVMLKYSKIKWIYSAWGSDMYYYNRMGAFLEAQKVLGQINFMFSDCERDYRIANENSFNGIYLGKFPGRGGYDVKKYSMYLKSFSDRNVILIKGYQGKHGRCIEVLNSLLLIKSELSNFKIIVFGASEEVVDFVDKSDIQINLDLEVFGKISHDKVMELMGATKVYIGNSQSDGIPNSLLEAIVMNAYPIQSNPGGATEELIKDKVNGRIIKDPLDTEQIALVIKEVINNPSLETATLYNSKNIKPELERKFVEMQVLKAYGKVEKLIFQ